MTPAEWFWVHGVQVFPTVNKVPAVPKGTSQFDYRCSRGQAMRFREYGVPLSAALGVLDTDNHDDELWVLKQIWHRVLVDTPFLVETARGFHRYYRLAGPLPKFIHRDGHTVEFRNVGQHVVGPGSVRPDGAVYRASGWSWRWEDISLFPVDFVWNDGSCGRFSTPGEPYEFPDVVRAGERHDQLFRLLRSCKGKGWERDETRKLLTLANENRCDPPLTEDHTFDQWFARGWNKPDRPFTRTVASEIPDQPLEPNAPTGAWDLDSPGGPL